MEKIFPIIDESITFDQQNRIPYAECIGNILNELIDKVKIITENKTSSAALLQFETSLEHLKCLTIAETKIGAEDRRNRDTNLERARSQIAKLEQIVHKLESDYAKQLMDTNQKICEKKSEAERLQATLDKILDIKNRHTQNIREETQKTLQELETSTAKTQETLLVQLDNLGQTLAETQDVNAKLEHQMRERRCFTQNALDELACKREKEILYKKIILDGVDEEYRRHQRVLLDLESKIHQVEVELDQIKEQRRQASEKHNERRHKLRDVFRTIIRVRFAFQKNV